MTTATMTKQLKTSLENNLTCKWCNKTFMSERTLSAHMCVKKRRWADKDLTPVSYTHLTLPTKRIV